jgi:predicted metalloprotease with PDZ domain
MAKGGVMLGDRIVAIDGLPLTDQPDMLAKLAAAGDHVEIDVDRKGRRLRLAVSAGATAQEIKP